LRDWIESPIEIVPVVLGADHLVVDADQLTERIGRVELLEAAHPLDRFHHHQALMPAFVRFLRLVGRRISDIDEE
jgi:hypothetical protein